ncbi:MAG TPA: carbohydrate kinase family protein [Candidatus Saccharimonadales bacterium]
MSEFDVLAVGDVVTDAFIRLFDDNARSFQDEKGNWLAMPYGTKIPYDQAYIVEAVGNASNAAVNFAKFGLKSGLVSNVGGDQYGRDIINTLGKKKVDTRFVSINPDKISNYHYVLWYKEERTILIKHETYKYHWPHLRENELPKWLYFSSVAGSALEYNDQLADWLEENKTVKLALQPGTFQLEAGVERLKKLYKNTEILVVNREEAVQITGGNYDNLHGLLDTIHSYGPKTVVITDGPAGAYASDGKKRIKIPIYPDPKPPYERTGAGDAFASTLVAAIIKGYDLEAAIALAPISSMNVVQYVGAQQGLLSENELLELLKKAPTSYKIENF